MSFSYRIKNEICSNRPFRQKHKKALAYGLLLFGKTFGMEHISLHTENRAVAKLYADGISDLVGLSESLTVREIRREGRRSVYVVTVDGLSDRIAILSYFGYKAGEPSRRIRMEALPESEYPAFLSGAFLACGTVSDPEKGYHAEFVIPDKSLCSQLADFLDGQLSAPKNTTRRNDYLLYYKESEPIDDLLTYICAAKCSLDMMAVKIVKGVRNKVNRETNCETANIGKTIDAAVSQIEAIRYILAHGGMEAIPEDLREIASLRLDNPEMSLRELGSALQSPISRSGANHRLNRILTIAQEMKKKGAG